MTTDTLPAEATTAHTVNLEVEKAVLAVLLDGRHLTAWDIALEVIQTPIAFSVRDHRIVFLGCLQLAAEGTRIDAQAVAQCLSAMEFGTAVDRLRAMEGLSGKLPPLGDHERCGYEDSALAAIGGFNAISDMATVFSPAAGLERNCRILAEHHRQRRMIEAFAAGLDRLRKPQGVKEVDAVVDDTLNRCLAQTSAGGTAFISAAEALADHDAVARGDVPQSQVRFGIPELDEVISPRPGELWTLAANTGCGKTSLLLHALTATAEAQGPGSVAICSQEMGRKELAQIYIARRLRIARKIVRDGGLTQGQRDLANEVEAWLEPLKIAIRDSGTSTVKDVCAWAQARKRLCPNLALIAVDYLGLLKPTNPRQDERAKLVEATGALKQLARSLNVAVLLLAQMSNEARKQERNRDGTLKRPPEPQTTDLKGSGSIGDDSDGVMFLWRPTDELWDIELKVTKCRADALPRVRLRWTPWEGQRFSAMNPREPDTHSTGRTRHDRINNQDKDALPW